MKTLINKTYKNFATQQNLLKTALHDYHIDVLNAKMVGFAGYNMPVFYPEGVMKEHLHCRQHASIFDVSHMGSVKIYGKDRQKFLETITVGDIGGLQNNQACLSLILNEKAGIIDDTIVTKFSDHIHMVINAGNKQIDLEHFENIRKSQFLNQDLNIVPLEEVSLIALQGPLAQEVLQKLVQQDLNQMKFMHSYDMKIEILDIQVQVSRCGYTGEDGFEIQVNDSDAINLCDLLFKNDLVKPAGLGSRDSLRLEAGLCLHGNDMSQDITPAEATLMWTVRKGQFDTQFIGQEYLENQRKIGINKKRMGFILQDTGVVRQGQEINNLNGEKVGTICSGTFSPILKKGIGMAYINVDNSKLGTMLQTIQRNKQLQLKIKKMPFVPAKYFK